MYATAYNSESSWVLGENDLDFLINLTLIIFFLAKRIEKIVISSNFIDILKVLQPH